MSNETTFADLELPVHVNARLQINPALTGKAAFTHSMTATVTQPGGAILSPVPFPDAPDTGGTSRTACATASAAPFLTSLNTEKTLLTAQLAAVAALLPAATVTVTSVAANNGSLAGGTAVTITGTGFNFPVTGPTTVAFQGVLATGVTVASATSITCTTPKGVTPGPVGVTVSGPSGVGYRASAFTYNAVAAAPVSSSPAAGLAAGGLAVTITGSGFRGATSVTFGGTAATNFVLVSDSVITCTTPAHAAGAVNVVVVDPAGNGTITNGFTYS